MLIHLFVHTRRTLQIPHVAQAEKTESCERCRCNYGYTIFRRAIGRGSYFIFGSDAKATVEASREAVARANERLAKAIEPVPCPDCGWVQSAMIRQIRRDCARWMIGAGWLSLVVLLSAAGIILAITSADGHPITIQSQRLTLDAVALAFSLWIGLIGGRYAMICLIDPNTASCANRPAVPGAPIGYRIESHEITGKGGQVLADEPPGRVTVQLAVAQFPDQCCRCMETTSFSKKMRCGGLAYVELPFCHSCAARVGYTTAIVCAAGVLIGGAIAWATSYHIAGNDLDMIVGLACPGVIVGALVGWRVARYLRPVVLSKFKPDRNTVRIYFKNHQYAALMREEGRLI